MMRPSQQVPTDYNTFLSLLGFLVYLLIFFLIFYWFYSILKRMEKTLTEIKKLLEGKASTATDPKP